MSGLHPEEYQESIVLLQASSMSAASLEVCFNLLSSDSDGAPAVLGVTFAAADHWLKRWNSARPPASLGVVSMGDAMRSNDPSTGNIDWSTPPGSPVVSSVRPGDLTGLGITVNQYLAAWRNQSWGQGSTGLRVCFDSLTTLLQYNDIETVFRFLNVLIAHLREVEAGAHFHLDPGAHDAQTLATLTGVFDTVIELPLKDE